MSRSRYVHPKASLSANGARSFDLETKDVGGTRWRWQIDVARWNIRGAIISQLQEPNFWRSFGVLSHVECSRRSEKIGSQGHKNGGTIRYKVGEQRLAQTTDPAQGIPAIHWRQLPISGDCYGESIIDLEKANIEGTRVEDLTPPPLHPSYSLLAAHVRARV